MHFGSFLKIIKIDKVGNKTQPKYFCLGNLCILAHFWSSDSELSESELLQISKMSKIGNETQPKYFCLGNLCILAHFWKLSKLTKLVIKPSQHIFAWVTYAFWLIFENHPSTYSTGGLLHESQPWFASFRHHCPAAILTLGVAGEEECPALVPSGIISDEAGPIVNGSTGDCCGTSVGLSCDIAVSRIFLKIRNSKFWLFKFKVVDGTITIQ